MEKLVGFVVLRCSSLNQSIERFVENDNSQDLISEKKEKSAQLIAAEEIEMDTLQILFASL